MGRKLCGKKGEIAHYEQFHLFPQRFQQACFPGRQEVSLCGNVTSIFTFSHSVFNWLVFQGRQKVSLCGNVLNFNPKALNCLPHNPVTFNDPERNGF